MHPIVLFVGGATVTVTDMPTQRSTGEGLCIAAVVQSGNKRVARSVRCDAGLQPTASSWAEHAAVAVDGAVEDGTVLFHIQQRHVGGRPVKTEVLALGHGSVDYARLRLALTDEARTYTLPEPLRSNRDPEVSVESVGLPSLGAPRLGLCALRLVSAGDNAFRVDVLGCKTKRKVLDDTLRRWTVSHSLPPGTPIFDVFYTFYGGGVFVGHSLPSEPYGALQEVAEPQHRVIPPAPPTSKSGRCKAAMQIDEEGVVTSVEVRDCPLEFHAPVKRAAKQWRFYPKQFGGEFRPTQDVVVFNFK